MPILGAQSDSPKHFADGSVTKLGGDAEDFIPAERHRALYRGMTLPRRANYARGPHNQPALEQKIPGVEPLGPKTLIDDETILNRLRMAKVRTLPGFGSLGFRLR